VSTIYDNKICSLQQLFNTIISSTTTGYTQPKFALLAGAGCSITSGVASGNRMIDVLQKYTYLRQSEQQGANLLPLWNKDTDTMEVFISKIEHEIDEKKLQEFIASKENEQIQIFKNETTKKSLLRTLPNNLKLKYNEVFAMKNDCLELASIESIDSLWDEYIDSFLKESTYGFWM